MMEYTIVRGSDPKGLSQGVNELIKQGWKPLGGIGVGNNYFYQAMIRENSKP